MLFSNETILIAFDAIYSDLKIQSTFASISYFSNF